MVGTHSIESQRRSLLCQIITEPDRHVTCEQIEELSNSPVLAHHFIGALQGWAKSIRSRIVIGVQDTTTIPLYRQYRQLGAIWWHSRTHHFQHNWLTSSSHGQTATLETSYLFGCQAAQLSKRLSLKAHGSFTSSPFQRTLLSQEWRVQQKNW